MRFCVDIPECGSEPLSHLPHDHIINLHHFEQFFDYRHFFRRISRTQPVIWTLHDMHPFTGGCYYSRGCDNFVRSCGSCPVIKSQSAHDLSSERWGRKYQVYHRLSPDLHKFITPSSWLANEAKRSSLLQGFDIETVPYGIDTKLFSRRDPAFCKDFLGLPKDKVVVLFCSSFLSHPLKGLDYLIQALKIIGANDNFVLTLVGSGSLPCELPVPCVHLGPVTDERLLPLVYSAADFVVTPSVKIIFPM